jgi:hypothetical protein
MKKQEEEVEEKGQEKKGRNGTSKENNKQGDEKEKAICW